MKIEIPRMFVHLPEQIRPKAALPIIEAAVATGAISWLLIPRAFCQHADAASLKQIISLCHAEEIAVLLADSPELATQFGADGVHLSGDSAFSHLRQTLPEEMMIGVYCGASRHQAMIVGEAGADYVAFESWGEMADGVSLLSWWGEMFTVPCVAFDPVPLEELKALSRHNPDFLTPVIDPEGSPDQIRSTILMYEKLMAGAAS